MANLSLYLLGPTRVKLDEEDIEVKPRKALALLIYLAVTAERHARDALATMLWPSSTQRSARHALRSRLSELNQTLGAGWIEADRESVGLRPGYWLDVTEFLRYLADGAAGPQSLTAAAELYRDDFLTGFTLPDCPEYDEWQFFQSEGYRQALASAVEQLVGLLSEQGEYQEAIPYARRWLALDPLHEPAHRQLMRLYAQSGQQAAALRQYEQCRQILEEELGVAPSQETEALYKDIQAGDLTRQTKRPRPHHNLPVQTTTFIGRESEIADIKRLLVDEPGCRLLNLVGPGGIGKTRLALAAAAQLLGTFPDGVYFVSLAPVSETDDIIPTVAKALDLTFFGQGDPKSQLLDHLTHRKMLIVADNFEHLLSGAQLLTEIVSHAPDVTLLITSRERLNLREEWAYDVQGLPYPVELAAAHMEDSQLLVNYSSVQLFLQRARRVSASFNPSAEDTVGIIRVCQLVDGMPLGLELAAPWVRSMSCREIADEIERNLDFLTASLRNIPERHRSLRVVFEQTWERLSPEERSVLQQLSVFRGGCTREAAEQVTRATLAIMASLVDKALLRRDNLGRYDLHELIRQFAESKLAADPDTAEETQQNHQNYFIEFLEKQSAKVKGAGQAKAIREIKMDRDNIRLVWRRAVTNRDAESIDRSVECLAVYYTYSSGHYEGQAAFGQAVAALAGEQVATERDVQAQHLATIPDQLKNLVGLLLAAQAYFISSTSGRLVRQEQEIAALLEAKPGHKRRVALGFAFLSYALIYQGKTEEAKPYAERGIALGRETDELFAQWWSTIVLANPAVFSQPLKAESLLKEVLVVAQTSGDPTLQGYSRLNLGRVSTELGKYRTAARFFSEVSAIFEKLDNVQAVAYNLEDTGRLETALGNYARAIQLHREAITIYEDIHTAIHASHCRVWLAEALRFQGDFQEAEELSRQELATFEALNDPRHVGYCLLNLGLLAQAQRDFVQAEKYLNEALKTWGNTGHEARIADASRHLGYLMVAVGERRHVEAIHYFQQGLEVAAKHQMAPIALDICVGAAQLFAYANEFERAVELLVLTEQHEASTFDTAERARNLLVSLEQQLPSRRFEEIRLQQQDLWFTLEALSAKLVELSQ